jgi:hypothetical protein
MKNRLRGGAVLAAAGLVSVLTACGGHTTHVVHHMDTSHHVVVHHTVVHHVIVHRTVVVHRAATGRVRLRK